MSGKTEAPATTLAAHDIRLQYDLAMSGTVLKMWRDIIERIRWRRSDELVVARHVTSADQRISGNSMRKVHEYSNIRISSIRALIAVLVPYFSRSVSLRLPYHSDIAADTLGQPPSLGNSPNLFSIETNRASASSRYLQDSFVLLWFNESQTYHKAAAVSVCSTSKARPIQDGGCPGSERR